MNVFLSALALAFAICALALLVAVSGTRRQASSCFAAFLTTSAFWLLTAVAYRVFEQPSETFMLNSYKLAYTLDLAGMTALLFFAYALDKTSGPPRGLLIPVLSFDALLIAASWSGLLIRRAYLSGGVIHLELRPLYNLFIAWITVKAMVFARSLLRVRKRSRGMERTSVTYVLGGFLASLGLVIAGAGIYPALSDRDIPGDWISFTVIVPAAVSSYVIFRYRLLQLRLSARRILSWFLAVGLVVGLSLTLILLMRRISGLASQEAQAFLALALLMLTVLTAPLVYRFTDWAATRFLFAGIYRPEDLLNRITRRLDETVEMGRGLGEALYTACREMGLEKLLFALPREGREIRLLGCRFHSERGYVQVDEAGKANRQIHQPLFMTMIHDTSGSGKPSERMEGLWAEMEEEGINALVPSRSPSGWMGNILAGRRMGGLSLQADDLDLLEQLAGVLAAFIETSALATTLLERMEMLRSSTRELAGRIRLRRDAAIIVSHELRTPLTSVVGFAHLLKENYHRLDEAIIEECLSSIEENTARLERILSTLEEVNRLREGKVVLRRERVNVEELFTRVRMLLSPAENRRVDYRLPKESADLLTDPYLVLLILRNLLSNALRFSPPESKVVLQAISEAGRVTFRVSDEGPGIRPESLEEAFQPFTSLVEVDKHQGGTGLGLYAARLAAEMLGTHIEVLTEPGKGSAFYFSLPLLQE